jgi:thioredoxin-dependent peroxiredoxin
MIKLRLYDKAPDFTGRDQNGNAVTLNEFIGNTTIIFFYPEACFAGCGSGSCSLRDNIETWKEKGYKIICVCTNNFDLHRNFVKRYKLQFTVIEDADKQIALKYGVRDVTEANDPTFHATFMISREGIIKKIIHEVNRNEFYKKMSEIVN